MTDRPMSWLARGVTSSIGNKQLVAVTGVGLVAFLVAHLAGNLQVYVGREAFNDYAAKLKALPMLLWVLRGGLVVFAVAHVAAAVRAARRNRAARAVPYARYTPLVSKTDSRSMLLTGLLVLAFALYHLAHFTWGLTHPAHFALRDELGRHDAYSMLVLGFRSWPVSLSYVAAMFVLGLHISHGLPSLLQTLGINHPRVRPGLEKAVSVLVVVLVAGFVSIPVAVLLGLVPLPDGVL